MKEKRIHIITFWLPLIVLMVISTCSILYWNTAIRFVSFGPDPGLTKGTSLLPIMFIIVVIMLIYWFLERRGTKLIEWMVWLHVLLSLGAVLALCGGISTFRSVSWVGGSVSDLEPGIVGFRHLSRPLFWLFVAQVVGIAHGLVLWLNRNSEVSDLKL